MSFSQINESSSVSHCCITLPQDVQLQHRATMLMLLRHTATGTAAASHHHRLCGGITEFCYNNVGQLQTSLLGYSWSFILYEATT